MFARALAENEQDPQGVGIIFQPFTRVLVYLASWYNVVLILAGKILMLYILWRIIKNLLGAIGQCIANIIKRFKPHSDDDEDDGDMPQKRNRYLYKRNDNIIYPKRKPKLVGFDGVEPWERAFYRLIKPLELILLRLLMAMNKGDGDPAKKLRNFDSALERDSPSLCVIDDWILEKFDKIRLTRENPEFGTPHRREAPTQVTHAPNTPD